MLDRRTLPAREDICARVFVQDRRVFAQRLGTDEDGRQLLVLDVDQAGRRFGRVLRLGCDGGDALPDEADLLVGQDGPVMEVTTEAAIADLRPGQDGAHSRVRSRGARIDREDPRVGKGADGEGRPQHVRFDDVRGVLRLSADFLAALDPDLRIGEYLERRLLPWNRDGHRDRDLWPTSGSSWPIADYRKCPEVDVKIARFDEGRIGVVKDDEIYDVSAACGVDPKEWPPVGIVRVIADWASLRPKIEAADAGSVAQQAASPSQQLPGPSRGDAGTLVCDARRRDRRCGGLLHEGELVDDRRRRSDRGPKRQARSRVPPRM